MANSSYQRGKERARERAINTQLYLSENAVSYGDLAIIQHDLEYYGRRYGLLKEFRENGIL